jgi:hypothetical protein
MHYLLSVFLGMLQLMILSSCMREIRLVNFVAYDHVQGLRLSKEKVH